jgi:hypothetical protein
MFDKMDSMFYNDVVQLRTELDTTKGQVTQMYEVVFPKEEVQLNTGLGSAWDSLRRS